MSMRRLVFERARPMPSAARGAVAAVAGVAALGAACVHIELAPNGVSSARLDPTPAAIVLGDVLRDSVGTPISVRGVAYDANSQPLATAAFRYAYVPSVPDTTPGATLDTALVVDSVTGMVRAGAKWLRSTGRVVARVGTNIQLADTLQIVPRPDSLIATVALDTLRYDCTDDRPNLIPRDTLGFFNTVGPFTLVVRGDSAGTRIPVRRWLVRWTVESAPAAIPTFTLPTKQTVPAIAVIANAVDRPLSYDTTDATGTSTVRLRIRPTALGPGFSRDTLFRVRLRADVIAGAGVPVRGSPARDTTFVVLMSRNSVPVVPNVASCPR